MATTANTPTQYYLSNKDVAGACDKNFKKIDKECAAQDPEKKEKENHPVLNKLFGPNLTKKFEAMAAKVKGEIPTTNDNRWMSHCHGLWIKPKGVEAAEFNQMLQSMSNDLGSALKNVVDPMLSQLKTAAEKEVADYAQSQANKALAREAGEILLGGGPEDPVGDVIAGLDRLYTMYKIATFSPEVLEQLKDLMDFKDMATKAAAEMKDLAGNLKNMTPTQQMATGMGVLGRLNPCTRARRCLMVPFDKTETGENLGGHGCCPGQSGHHILPDAMTKDGNCLGYAKGDAPTLCVEGVNNGNGTHGQIHDVLVKEMSLYKSSGRDTMNYDTARDKGILSVMATFPESKCSEKCLKAQLDAYYEKKCTKQLPAVAGKKFKDESNSDSNVK